MRRLKLLLFIMLLTAVIRSPAAEAQTVESLLCRMTLEEKVGQMLFAAFRTQAAQGVTFLTPEVALAMSRYRLGGVILFRENLINREQTTKLISDLQTGSAGIPLFIGIDQEGGCVTRLP